MLLQQIVEKLDSELDRLQRLREIVAGLRGGPSLETSFAEVARAVLPETAPTEVPVQRLPPRLPRERQRRQRSAANERQQTALTSAIPARPVVVSADALARETAAKKQAQPEKPKVVQGTLGAMIRALGPQGAV